jgi:hypothetical protein
MSDGLRGEMCCLLTGDGLFHVVRLPILRTRKARRNRRNRGNNNWISNGEQAKNRLRDECDIANESSIHYGLSYLHPHSHAER